MGSEGSALPGLLRSSRRPWTWQKPLSSWRQPLLDGPARQNSFVLGTQTHRLPFRVMWSITLLTALAMAAINFATILAIEYSVRWKFAAMQFAISRAGVGPGIL